jgi:RNA polymerase sigma factor (sigma-70 family)
MVDSLVSRLSSEEVARHCREEARRNRERESGYCFELFRRALEAQDEGAWQAIQEQYRGMVLNWLQTAAHHRLAAEEAEDLLQNTLEKFWRTLGNRRKLAIAERFAHVGALLKYLRQCAVTAQLDARRQAQRRDRLNQILIIEAETAGSATGGNAFFEQRHLEHLYQEEQLQKVRRWLHSEVEDELEKLVLQLSYEQALKPADIAAGYPQQFASVHEVRQIKERVLKRARRALLA